MDGAMTSPSFIAGITGEVVLITGSGRGLGNAVARILAIHGAHVAIHDLSQSAPAEFGEYASLDAVADGFAAEFGVKTVAVTADITDEDEIATLFDKAESKLGRISRVVHCAGGDIGAAGRPHPNDSIDVSVADLRAVLERNLIGTILVGKAAAVRMRAQRRGAIVTIASTAAHIAPDMGAIYAVAKAGVVHYTRCLAKDLRPFGVRANCISPGPTVTARFSATRTVNPDDADPAIPLRIIGQPDEVADAVVFLLSEAARHISGQVLRVDGGSQLFPA